MLEVLNPGTSATTTHVEETDPHPQVGGTDDLQLSAHVDPKTLAEALAVAKPVSGLSLRAASRALVAIVDFLSPPSFLGWICR